LIVDGRTSSASRRSSPHKRGRASRRLASDPAGAALEANLVRTSEHLTGCSAERPGSTSGPAATNANAQRSDAGWATARDRFPGRVVERRPVVGMAPPYMLDTVVNRRDAVAGGRPPPCTKM